MTQLIKVWDIPGGVHPPENKAQSLIEPLTPLAIAPQLILPLNQHIGAPAKVLVEVGQQVLGGELLAEADGVFSAHVHAPTSGTVAAIVEHVVPHPSGMTDTCIILDTDGQDSWQPLDEAPDYQNLDKAALLARVRAAGIAGLGGAGFPTAVKLNPRANQPIDTLIINGTECEPYITADDILMQNRADEIIAGTQILSKLLGEPGRVVIGIEDNKPDAIATLREAAKDTRIEVVSFPTKYPSGGEKQLIQILTGREVPAGQIPASIGIVCQNVGTTAAVYRAVRFGEPLVKRITTVVGEALDTQRNVEVLLGTPIRFVLEQHGFNEKKASRLVMGGPMMGFSLPDTSVPLVKTTNCILAPTRKELPPPSPAQACIRCGMCAEACPADLLPQQLFWYAQSEDLEKLEAHNLFDCIECGACSFVCPSHIPLVQYYRAAKGEIRQHRIDKEKSDRSRRRFEFRKERIAKEEAEKEAKRLARKKAAEEAKKKLAEQKAATGDAKTAPAPAPADDEKQRAKLERIVAAAEDSLKQAQKPLEDATDEQREKQQARIKQADVKLKAAQDKLAALGAATSAEPAPTDKAAPAKAAADDPVSAAIERAKAKVAMSPEDKLRSSLESLYKRLAKAEDKAREAREQDSDKADALEQGVSKLKEKIASTQKELDELTPSNVAEPTPRDPSTSDTSGGATADAASNAIEKAKARAAAMSTMSAADKLRNQVDSLEARLEKSRARLSKAEAENDENIDAFKAGVEKLEVKLAATREQLAQQNEQA
ncbi:electron transport complex subunit RsxC [Gilvimarinus agarilyticus]|uniref:electron transport complex subunit RsxC n=1 Tax=Gilvimarinus agarilyticus TaxID=679259 RepID=UPI0005A1F6FD|nr:electron transport complex subunit RsxC [Gilvimarinus agarilyticus]